MKIAEVAKMVGRYKRLVVRFNHSSKSYYALQQKQIDLHHKQLNLVQDVVTRWNSVLYMIEHIHDQQQPLCATLLEIRKINLMSSDEEFTNIWNSF